MGLIYEISNLNGYYREVNPIGGTKISGEREDNEFFYNKSIDGIKLHKEDYQSLIAFEDELNDFNISIKCNGNELFKGLFNMQSASICKDKCTIQLNITPNTIYDCIKKRSVNRNIISTPALSKVNTKYRPASDGNNYEIIGDDEYKTLTASDKSQWGAIAVNTPFTYAVAWARDIIIEPCINGYTLPSGATLINDDCNVSGFFTYSLPYTGSPMLSNSDGTCNSIFDFHQEAPPCNGTVNPCSYPQVYIGTVTFGIVAGQDVTYCIWVNPDIGFGSGSISLERGYLLNDVLFYLANETECGISCFKSDFFNDTINYVTGEDNLLSDIVITEMSDITRANSVNPATVLNLNILELYEKLKEVFNLIYRIDSDGCFRIEHISRAIDNTIKLEDIGEVIKSPCCYSVERKNIPKTETWSWNEAIGIDFIGKDIDYSDSNGNFYSISGKEEDKHDVSDVSTDLGNLYLSYPETDNLDGYVLTANEFDGTNYTVINEVGELSGINISNGHLSQANLHENYWKHNRYLYNGSINNVNQNFLSVKPYKDNDEISVRICCEDFYNLDLDFKSIQTSCGTGIIESYEYDLSKGILKLNISF